jgi:hypothetical protein
MVHLVAIPFSDPAGGAKAVEALLAAPRHPLLEVELIAMVEALRPGKVAVFVSPEHAERDARVAATRWLSELEQRLGRAHVNFRSTVVVGPVTRTLRSLAERRDFARLMVADPASSPWRSWLRHAALRSAQPAITFVP